MFCQNKRCRKSFIVWLLYVVVVPKSWFFVHRRCTCLRFNIEPQNGHDLCHNVRKSFSKLQTTSLFFRIRCGGDFPWIIGISWDIRYNPEKKLQSSSTAGTDLLPPPRARDLSHSLATPKSNKATLK